MTDEQRQAAMQAQYDGMRAMSNEEMARRQLEAADGARNAYTELTSWQLAQASQNLWAQCRGKIETPPIKAPPKETLLARIKQWIRA